jgi:class 3 adenylate cyclase
MTLVEFLHPVRKSSNRDKCLTAIYHLHHHQAVGSVSVEQIRAALKQARVPNAASINVSDVLNKAGHLVDYTEAVQGKRVWKLTSSGDDYVRKLLDLTTPQAAVTSEHGPTKANVSAFNGNGSAVRRVVVEVDLSRYSDIARNLEQNLGVEAVAKLNEQIEKLVETALNSVGARVSETRLATTGDGAILAFESAKQASEFAQALHRVAQAHNLGKTVESAQRHFRIGIYSGDIVLTKETTASGEFLGFKMAGTTIADAVRSEAAAKTGEVLISADTWGDLPHDMRKWYGPEEIIRGKRDEQLRVHRRRVVDPAPWDA